MIPDIKKCKDCSDEPQIEINGMICSLKCTHCQTAVVACCSETAIEYWNIINSISPRR